VHAEEAMARRKERQAFVSRFPGRLHRWEECAGKTIQRVSSAGSGRVLLFEDGSFLVAAEWSGSPDDLQAVLMEARSLLEPAQPAGYAELDRLRSEEAEAMRLGRMEKIVGAVRTNLPQIPELREALQATLDSMGGPARPRDTDEREQEK
jgi:hypothetical protein